MASNHKSFLWISLKLLTYSSTTSSKESFRNMASPVHSPPALPNSIKTAKSKSKLDKSETSIGYNTGVHQGDNIPLDLFSNPSTCKGRLLSQKCKCKRQNLQPPIPFLHWWQCLHAWQPLQFTETHSHFKRFCLSMHVGNTTQKSKTVAMFFHKPSNKPEKKRKKRQPQMTMSSSTARESTLFKILNT